MPTLIRAVTNALNLLFAAALLNAVLPYGLWQCFLIAGAIRFAANADKL